MKVSWTTLSVLALLTATASADETGLKPTPRPPPPATLQATPQTTGGSHTSFLVGGSDTCATPDVISGLGPFNFDNSMATTGTQGQANVICTFFNSMIIARDVWFTWTAPLSGTATLQICGFSTVDTKVAVYNGLGCPSGAAIGCNDDNCATYQSTVVFPAISGNTYTFQIGTYPGGAGGAPGGTGQFTISINPAPLNDNCSTPTIISGNGPFNYDTSLATTGTQGQTNTRCHIYNTTTIDFDVWYTWTAASTGWVSVDTCTGGMHDLRIAVYAGAGCPSAEPIICDDDGCGTLGGPAQARFLATAGSVYTFQIGSYQGHPGAPGFFTISPFTPAPGDDCGAPIDISGVGTIPFDCTNGVTGTQGQAEALCGGGPLITYDIWYRWTSFCTGNVDISACMSTVADTKMAVYAGSGCPTSGAIICDDDGCTIVGGPSKLTFAATSGTTYMIQVGMWPGEVPSAGAFEIATPCPPPVGTVFCTGDGVSPHTNCPCSNVSATADQVGCLNSLGTGGMLRAQGNASLADDQDGTPSLTLVGTLMPSSSVLYFQGTTQVNGGNGAAFGDGLRCAGGSIVRLKTLTNVAGASQYPTGTQPAVSIKGLVTIAGTTRTYQAWYRNAASFCTASTFNLTNGVSITWGS